MRRERPALGTPYGTEGPWLAAIVDVLNDLHDLLDARLPAAPKAEGGGPVRVTEPAPAGPQVGVPIAEPAPAPAPAPDEADESDAEPVEITEPAPDPTPLPDPPPRAGKGSGLEAWQTFADLTNVQYPAEASRNDIIAACVKAGVITAD